MNGWMHNEGHGFGWIEVNVDGWMEIWMGGCRWGWINVDVDGWMDADVDGWIQLQIDGSRCKWMVAYMVGMVAGDGSDADGDVKYIPTGPYEEVGGSAPLNFFGNFYWF